MVILRAARGHSAAPSSPSWAVAALLLAVAAPGQEQPAAAGRIVADEARLRCWSGAVAAPPLFEDVLVKDQIVPLGRAENGFRAVLLPLGPVGYVSRKFSEERPDGRVVTKGAKVSFRYRPRSSDAPVAQLPEGTELFVVGEQDDWFRCRVPGIEAWIAASEVEEVDSAEAPRAAMDQLRKQHEADVNARLARIAAAAARARQDEVDLAALKVIEDAFARELGKPLLAQDFAPLVEASDKLRATLADDSRAVAELAALQKRIETQRWIAEATALRTERPPPPAAQPQPLRDELARFESIGWLRCDQPIGLSPVYYLEKGGRRQVLLTCNTGRYDLSLFVGREVGVLGPRRKPPGQQLGVLDVERLEVLGSLRP